MVFFGKFWDSLRDWEIGDVGGQFSGAWQGVVRAFGPSESPEELRAQGIDPEDMSFWDHVGRRVSGLGQAVGGAVGGLNEIPVLRQAFALLDAAYTDIVARPVATLGLVLGDVAARDASILDGDVWRQAYNATNYVSPGQALVYAELASRFEAQQDYLERLEEQDELAFRELLRDYPDLAEAWAYGVDAFDPRAEQGRRQYYEDTRMRLMSGTIDAGLTLFADPAVAAASVARGAYRYGVKNPLDAAAIQSGKLDSYLERKSYRKLKDYVFELANKPDGTSEQLRRLVFNNHYNGDLAAALLFDAAKFAPRYQQLGSKIDVYDTTFRALYGDEAAWRTLTSEAKQFAEKIADHKSVAQRMHAGNNYGLGDTRLDAQWDALKDAKFQAWLDAIVTRRGHWGVLHETSKFGLLTDVPGTRVGGAPRITLTSRWRAGVHEWMRNRPSARLGFWMRRSRMLLPSQRTGRMLDLNDRNSIAAFRATLGMSRLSQQELDEWVSAYARATTPEGRFAVYQAAENAAVKKALERYGITERQFNDLIPVLNKFRSTNRAIFNRNRMFASTAVVREIERRKAAGQFERARELERLQQEIQQAVERGDMPEAFYTVPDPEGILTLIPEDSVFKADSPLMITQHADMVPMVDFHVLENALWWLTGGGSGSAFLERAGQGMWYAKDFIRMLLDTANTVWKASAILRPGYIWRTLTDELLRVYAVMGSARFWGSVGRGIRNYRQNMRSRGRLIREQIGKQRARRLATGQDRIKVKGELVAQGKGDVKPKVPEGFRYDDLQAPGYDEAFALGIISSEDFIDRVLAHGSAGTLPDQYHTLYDAYQTGAINFREFRNLITNFVLRQHNRGAFTSPSWQKALIDNMLGAAAKTREELAPRAIAVDPFTGTIIEDLSEEALGRDWKPFMARGITRDEDGFYKVDDVYDYIMDHLDDLAHPDNLLGIYFAANGRLTLAVYKNMLGKGAEYKPTPDKRVKLPLLGKGELYQDSGTALLEIETPSGPVVLRGGFMGDEGDRFRKQVSSRGPQDAILDLVVDTEYARMNIYADRWVDVSPSEGDRYNQAWERAVNAQIANDPIANMFLRGMSERDVIRWLFDTEAGRRYQAQMGDAWRAHYAENILGIQALVDTYVPMVPGKLEESRELRRKAAKGEATIADLERVVPRYEMPLVHGASLEGTLNRGPVVDFIRKLFEKTWRMLSTLPQDKFVRFPFAAERYKIHAQELAQMQGWNDLRVDKVVHPDELRVIEREARNRALADVHQYMFHANGGPDLARAARLFSPFGSSLVDSLLKHGIAMRVNPERYWQIYKIWTAPENAGLVTDDDGNELRIEDGQEVWYRPNPITGEWERIENYNGTGRYITFRLPSWLTPDSYKGSRPIVRINKKVFHIALDLPSFGPLVGLPASEFALDNPEFAENRFVERFILPFGPSANPAEIVVPANVRNLWRTFVKEDEDFAKAQVTAIFAADMTDYSLGLRPDPPTFEEAREKAADLRMLRFAATFMGVSTQFQSPYQPYVDYYRQLRLNEVELRKQAVAEGRDLNEVESADEVFLREAGPEYFSLTASVTRNVLGIPPTIPGQKAYKKYKDLIDKHPEIASLIIGAEGAGAFNRSVYEAQQRLESRPGSGEALREVQSPEEAWEEVERRKGWIEYGKLSDLIQVYMNKLGLHSLETQAAAPLKAVRDKWIAAKMFTVTPWGQVTLSPWYRDYRQIDTSRMMQRLMSMRAIVQDERLQGRDDIRGLIQYLALRDQFKAFMRANGIATLDSQEALPLKLEWDRVVNVLKNSNLSFAALYDRWLYADNLQVD